MPDNDAFTLQKSGFNAFLFAEVGIEQNGSTLTLLSTLARLGKDPWAQAAEWARMPKAAMLDGLTQSIARMPLGPGALADARATAGRLAMLLPSQTGPAGQAAARTIGGMKMPEWVPVIIFCVVIGLAIVAGTFAAPTTTTTTVMPAATPTVLPAAPSTLMPAAPSMESRQ
jgi:disulfide bond formation protein DsbB